MTKKNKTNKVAATYFAALVAGPWRVLFLCGTIGVVVASVAAPPQSARRGAFGCSPSPAMATAADHVSTSSLFTSLLEQSRKLRQETDSADLPPIQLGLGEIERRANELKKTPADRQTDARACVAMVPLWHF